MRYFCLSYNHSVKSEESEDEEEESESDSTGGGCGVDGGECSGLGLESSNSESSSSGHGCKRRCMNTSCTTPAEPSNIPTSSRNAAGVASGTAGSSHTNSAAIGLQMQLMQQVLEALPQEQRDATMSEIWKLLAAAQSRAGNPPE